MVIRSMGLGRSCVASLAVGVLAVSVTACGGGGGGGGGGNSNGPIALGAILAETGTSALNGTGLLAGAQAAVDQINSKGGIGGRKVKLYTIDDKSDPTSAVRAASTLISSDHVIGIFGATTGSETLSILGAAERAQIPVVAPSATVALTDPKQSYSKWVFRDAPFPPQVYPAFLKKFAAEGNKKIAVFYQNDAYGTSSYGLTKSDAAANGVSIVAAASADVDASDVSVQVNKLLAAKPDAIFLVTSIPDLAGLVLRTATSLGFDGTIYGSEGAGQQAVIDAAQGNASHFKAPLMVNPTDTSSLPALTELMKGHGGVTNYPNLLGAEGIAIFQAGLSSGATTGTALRDAIQNAGTINGYAKFPASYTASNHDGFPAANYVWASVQNNHFVFEK